MDCIECVIFTLKPGKGKHFREETEPKLEEECKRKFKGLVATLSFQVLDKADTFMHFWIWTDPASAKAGFEQFETLAIYADFVDAVEKIDFMEHLTPTPESLSALASNGRKADLKNLLFPFEFS